MLATVCLIISLLQLAEYAEANCACGYEGENQFEVSIKPLFVGYSHILAGYRQVWPPNLFS